MKIKYKPVIFFVFNSFIEKVNCASICRIILVEVDSFYMNLTIKAQQQQSYDAIVIGSGISESWTAKELCDERITNIGFRSWAQCRTHY